MTSSRNSLGSAGACILVLAATSFQTQALAAPASSTICAPGKTCVQSSNATAASSTQPVNTVVRVDKRGQATTLVDVPGVGEFNQSLFIPPSAKAHLRSHQGDWGVFNRAGGAAAGFGAVGRYGAVRWAEDWSFLRGPKMRAADNDPFDRLKFIPLNSSGSVYLSFSGEERLKNWFENRPGLGTIKPNDSGRMTLQSI